MCTIKKCPVPFDQQPLNEYKDLKNSWFFSWSTIKRSEYISQLSYLFLTLFFLFIPIVYHTIPKQISLLKVFVLDLILVNIIFLLIFIRLYLGWSYIVKRLISATIFYEESGWYDGQIWIKSIDNLTQDRLVGFYEVIPFVTRIKYSLLFFTFLLVLYNIFYFLIL